MCLNHRNSLIDDSFGVFHSLFCHQNRHRMFGLGLFGVGCFQFLVSLDSFLQILPNLSAVSSRSLSRLAPDSSSVFQSGFAKVGIVCCFLIIQRLHFRPETVTADEHFVFLWHVRENSAICRSL